MRLPHRPPVSAFLLALAAGAGARAVEPPAPEPPAEPLENPSQPAPEPDPWPRVRGGTVPEPSRRSPRGRPARHPVVYPAATDRVDVADSSLPVDRSEVGGPPSPSTASRPVAPNGGSGLGPIPRSVTRPLPAGGRARRPCRDRRSPRERVPRYRPPPAGRVWIDASPRGPVDPERFRPGGPRQRAAARRAGRRRPADLDSRPTPFGTG